MGASLCSSEDKHGRHTHAHMRVYTHMHSHALSDRTEVDGSCTALAVGRPFLIASWVHKGVCFLPFLRSVRRQADGRAQKTESFCPRKRPRGHGTPKATHLPQPHSLRTVCLLQEGWPRPKGLQGEAAARSGLPCLKDEGEHGAAEPSTQPPHAEGHHSGH